ncbi:glycosyltransferase [Buchananella hordeovulneris]|uniref:glycosyltransferase n=1 Tax=Buchananella hordeovulneris TaxID=52770 RepID=UPI000F5DC27E|nr:glycosyltransferase [Buchananella hordeovulneris]RRD44532.1 glycosyltransferase [Buchananella hordeovulneris]
MRVTLVTRIHAPEPAAASLRLAAVERALVGRGHRVVALTSRYPGAAGADSDEPGVQVRRWPTLRAADGQLRGYLPYLSFDLPLVGRVLGRRRPHVFLVEPPPTTGAVMRGLAGLVARPYVWYAADVWSDAAAGAGAPGLVVRVVRALERFAVRGASAVIAVSDDVAARVKQLGARSVHVVRNGVDTELFTAHQAGPDEALRAQAAVHHPYFVYAGTASEWQGAEIFAQAAGQVADANFQLVFLGQGSAWPTIAAVAASLPPLPDGAPRVVLLGQRSAAEAAAWQAGALAALVSIRPGQGYDFAYPTKVLSALACGTPVLYAGVGPVCQDLADPLLGRAVDYDVAALAQALRELANAAPSEAAARAARHAWVAEHRSTRRVGQAVAEILEATVRARS